VREATKASVNKQRKKGNVNSEEEEQEEELSVN
jgi:hypothetical protein